MRIFRNKPFTKFARKEKISDAALCEVVRDSEEGRIDANYGCDVIKQRIARPNEGKSGGYRAIILFRQSDKTFFIYGFPKNKRDNISELEERTFKELAKITFALTESQLAKLIDTETYIEVNCDGQNQDLQE